MITQYARLISFAALLLFAAAVARAGPTASNKHINFTCSLDASSPTTKTLESYYRDAFQRLGYTFSMQQRPARRAIAEAASGVSDGDCARVKGVLDETYSGHLLAVDVIIGRTLSISGATNPTNR
jgi:hypothetical protein